MTKKRRGPLKERTLNFIIDDVVHPQIRKHPELKVVDVVLHFIVEGDPVRSAGKTIHYDFPKLVDALTKQKRATQKKKGRR
jgi:hypothetical protein